MKRGAGSLDVDIHDRRFGPVRKSVGFQCPHDQACLPIIALKFGIWTSCVWIPPSFMMDVSAVRRGRDEGLERDVFPKVYLVIRNDENGTRTRPARQTSSRGLIDLSWATSSREFERRGRWLSNGDSCLPDRWQDRC